MEDSPNPNRITNAQLSSNANATTLRADSRLIVERAA